MRRSRLVLVLLGVWIAPSCGDGSNPSDAGGVGDGPPDLAGDDVLEAGAATGDALDGDGGRESTPPGADGGPSIDARTGRMAAGKDFACALDRSGQPVCWGGTQVNGPPQGAFIHLDAGVASVCALSAAGEVVCWTPNTFSDAVSRGVPAGPFVELQVGGYEAGEFACARRATGEVSCWRGGAVDPGLAPSPGLRFAAISVGERHGCGVLSTGTIGCWGSTGADLDAVPGGGFVGVSSGGRLSCALRSTGTVTCWGSRKDLDDGFPRVARTVQTAMYPAADSICLLIDDGRVGCWGAAAVLGDSVMALRAVEIAVGDAHLCGVRSDDSVVCVNGTGTAGDIAAPPGLRVLARP